MIMIDHVPYDMPHVPNFIVYIVNDEVEKVIPAMSVHKNRRGFWVPVRDPQGNITLEYRKTAVVKTVYRDDNGNQVPLEKATGVNTQYLDEKGTVLLRPLRVIIRE